MQPSRPPQGPALVTEGALLGLRREVIATSFGPVVVRAGREAAGPATILLHGAAGSWTTWTPLIEESDIRGDPLTDVIAIDLPGWGESPLPRIREPEVPVLSAMVVEVARALEYRSWTVIGHSLGGFVALDLAVREPHATRSVGLISGTGAGEIAAIRHPFRGGARLPWFAGMLFAMRVLGLMGAGGRILVRLLQRLGALEPLMTPFFADRRAMHPSVVAALSREVRPRSFVLAARAAAVYDLQDWRRISCPVRLVQGERDVFVGARDLDSFAGLIRDFHYTMLPGAGHFAAVERPDAVLDFLGGARS